MTNEIFFTKTLVKHHIVSQNMVFEDDHQIIIDNAP